MVERALDEISLRLLRLFEVIYRTRNISRAADEMATSQPSVSTSLDRLRRLFEDPLFIRVGSRMEPTPRADLLIEGVRAIFAVASDCFVAQAPFDPATSLRRFTVHMTDPAEAILLPRFVRRMAEIAPGVRLTVRAVGDDSQPMLADGQADLIVGFLARTGEQLTQCKLHDERFVGIARVGHPRITSKLDLDRFRTECHVAVVIAGTGHRPSAAHAGAPINIALEVSSYFAASAAVAQTDLIALVPARLGAQLAAQGIVRVFDLPIATAAFQVRQYWHPRFHHDAGNAWLRRSMVEIVDR